MFCSIVGKTADVTLPNVLARRAYPPVSLDIILLETHLFRGHLEILA